MVIRAGRNILRGLVAIALIIALVIIGFRVAASFREGQTADAAAPATGRFVTTAKGRIFVSLTGPRQGKPVVLIHGSGAWGGLWTETSNALAKSGYRAIALDLPPFGFSDRPSSHDYSRVAQADRILALVDAMNLNKPIIVGHSFGGGPAIEAVMRAPDRFAKVILVDPALGIDAPISKPLLPLRSQVIREGLVATAITNPLLTKRMLQTLIYRKDRAIPAYVAILQQPLTRSGTTSAIAQWLPYLLQNDPHALSGHGASYKALQVPIAIIWGDKDTVTPLTQLKHLHGLVPTASVKLLHNTGHIPQVEDPDNFQNALLNALANNASSR